MVEWRVCSYTYVYVASAEMIEWPNGTGSIEIEGKLFALNQCHWHAPAEHTVDGKRYNLATLF